MWAETDLSKLPLNMKLDLLTHADGPSRTLSPTRAAIPTSRKGLAVRVSLVPAGPQAVRGMTLPEMMVAVSVGFIILLVVGQMFLTSAYSFAAMGNYVSLDRNSRNALDHMTREIRQAGDLLEFSPTHLKFAQQGATNSFLIYNWEGPSRPLTEWKSGDSAAKVLLTACDQVAFSLRNSLFAPTTVVSEGKGIGVSWKCSRTILGNRTTSEDMTQAVIIMRNKPL